MPKSRSKQVFDFALKFATPFSSTLGHAWAIIPLVADLFVALPSGVRMIHQPDATARALKAYLDRHPEYDGSHAGRRKFLSTGFPRGPSL